MTIGYRTRLLAMLLACGLAGGPALAQTDTDMTAEEIQKAFENQKTRGLSLVPSAEAEAAAAAETDSAAGTSVATAPVAYQPVDAADQVNVRISFDFDSAVLRDDQKARLSTMCEVMKSVDVSQFQIIGHTDASGSADYNRKLSELRAEEVKRHLVDDCGIPAERLQAVGMGESAPIDPGNPDSDANRRVEFQALG